MVKKVVLSEEGTFEPSTESQGIRHGELSGEEGVRISTFDRVGSRMVRCPNAFALESVKRPVILTSD